MTFSLSSVQTIIEEARLGRMFILVDDEARENEVDLMISAQYHGLKIGTIADLISYRQLYLG